MTVIKRLINTIDQYFYRLEMRRIEAYLAQAQSLEDLERRMRVLDKDVSFRLP